MVQPGVVYTTFHFPESGANVITTDNSDWGTNCPEYKVTAVQATRVSQPGQWQKRFRAFSEVVPNPVVPAADVFNVKSGHPMSHDQIVKMANDIGHFSTGAEPTARSGRHGHRQSYPAILGEADER